jgi:hypothetical protein
MSLMILDFAKPKKIRATKEHNQMYSSDSGVDGTYVPNMSPEAMEKWKAKQIGGIDPRIEIHKSVSGRPAGNMYAISAQMLMIVRAGSVVISSNGRLIFDTQMWEQLQQAVAEAQQLLKDEHKTHHLHPQL